MPHVYVAFGASGHVGADQPAGNGPIAGLHHLEQRLDRIPDLSPLHLRPGYFYENHLGSIGLIRATTQPRTAGSTTPTSIERWAAEVFAPAFEEGWSPIEIGLREPDETVTLAPGQRQHIAPRRVHRVANPAPTPVRHLLIQVGHYDFNTVARE